MGKNEEAAGRRVAALADKSAGDAAAVATVAVEHVLATDEHAGKGGSFVFDPATGQRTRAGGNEDELKGRM